MSYPCLIQIWHLWADNDWCSLSVYTCMHALFVSGSESAFIGVTIGDNLRAILQGSTKPLMWEMFHRS